MGRADAGLDDTRKLIDATRGEVEFVHKSADGYPGRLDLDLDKPFMSSMEHWVQKTTYDNTAYKGEFGDYYCMAVKSADFRVQTTSMDEGLLVELVSNAEYWYRDVILPAMGLNQGSEWDFGVFSGLEGFEKPDPQIYKIALRRAEILHQKQFKTPDAEEWRKSGATVLPDLVAAQEWLTSDQSTIQ
ncbi:hypothetical protein AgCh_034444 [Apium graveolens]